MAVRIVIPARYASTRLSAKPLVDIDGQPMLVRVMAQASRANADTVVAAVDHEDVFNAVTSAGYQALLTRIDHQSGSDRVMEVVATRAWSEDDIVVNVQGDEPLIPPEVIDCLANVLIDDSSVQMATVCEPILNERDYFNPHTVKVVRNKSLDAIYFSRAPIPYARDSIVSGVALTGGSLTVPVAELPVFRHVGIYAYRVTALRSFTSMGDSQLEQVEALEQLRWLEAGNRIRVIDSPMPVPGGVDTPQDLARVIDIVRSRKLT